MLTITQAKSQFKLRINSKNTEVKNVAKYLKVNPQKVQIYVEKIGNFATFSGQWIY